MNLSPMQLSDAIFSPTLHPPLDEVATADLMWRALSASSLPPALVEAVMYFVWPERVWYARLPIYKRPFVKQDLIQLRSHLQSCQRTHGKVGLPVTLLLGSPGIFALHLPDLVLKAESDNRQDHVTPAHRPEEIALVVYWLSKYGSALRTLHVALDLREDMAGSTKAVSAISYIFLIMARGGLSRLNHLTLLHDGVGTDATTSFLEPLARPKAYPLEKLRTLRLSFVKPEVPLRHLAALASRGGLKSLQDLSFFGECRVGDSDLVPLLQFLLDSAHSLRELDISCTRADVGTLSLIVNRLEYGVCPRLKTVTVPEVSCEASDSYAGLRRRIEELSVRNLAS